MQKSSWILRTFQTRDLQFLKCIWKTLIEGHIDYFSQFYLPFQQSDLQQIENLQKCLTNKNPSIKHLNLFEQDAPDQGHYLSLGEVCRTAVRSIRVSEAADS